MKKQVVIAMCGKTHSGKTFFGKKIARLVPKNVIIDHDVVAAFLKREFNNIHTDPKIQATRTPTNPDMRLLIPQLIYDYSLRNGYNVIITAAHTRKEIRRQQREIAKKYGAIFVLVFLNLPNKTLEKRVNHSTKSTNVLLRPNFKIELKKQHTYFENPSPEEADFFFEVKTNTDLKNVEGDLKNLIDSQS